MSNEPLSRPRFKQFIGGLGFLSLAFGSMVGVGWFLGFGYLAVSAFESPALANLVLSAGVIGLLTSWNGFFPAGTRVLFALGRGALLAFVNVGSFCISMAFVGVALSLLRLRKIAADLDRPYRRPAGEWVARCAAMGSLLVVLAMVIPASPAVFQPIEWTILAVLCLCGIVFRISGRGQRDTISEDDRGRLILNN